jgi:Gas vesicle synthesis protein GvpL/GvpF
MSAGLLLGFADCADLQVPSGLSIAGVSTVSALFSAEGGPLTLPEISAHLLKLQNSARIIPLRPANPPADLAGHVERISLGLTENFDRVGQSVEFVVQIKLSAPAAETAAPAPSDYLRHTQARERAYAAQRDSIRASLRAGIATLEAEAQLIKLGKRNLSEFAAIHYLMNKDHAAQIIAEWQAARVSLAGMAATLSGPWAPYSFVTLEG